MYDIYVTYVYINNIYIYIHILMPTIPIFTTMLLRLQAAQSPRSDACTPLHDGTWGGSKHSDILMNTFKVKFKRRKKQLFTPVCICMYTEIFKIMIADFIPC